MDDRRTSRLAVASLIVSAVPVLLIPLCVLMGRGWRLGFLPPMETPLIVLFLLSMPVGLIMAAAAWARIRRRKTERKGVSLAILALGICMVMVGIVVAAFQKAREAAQLNTCNDCMFMIQCAKEQWALAKGLKEDGIPVVTNEVLRYLPHGRPPPCPATGRTDFELGRLGEDAVCPYHGSYSSVNARITGGKP